MVKINTFRAWKSFIWYWIHWKQHLKSQVIKSSYSVRTKIKLNLCKITIFDWKIENSAFLMYIPFPSFVHSAAGGSHIEGGSSLDAGGSNVVSWRWSAGVPTVWIPLKVVLKLLETPMLYLDVLLVSLRSGPIQMPKGLRTKTFHVGYLRSFSINC